MRFGRRLSFQLMPLLDLLLIMIFSLYLEVRVDAERHAKDSAQRIEAQEQVLDAREAEIRTRLADVVAQQQRVGDLVAELFDVPQELIDEALMPLPAGAPPRPLAETERLRERFRELAALRGPQVVEHLLSYEELRKRADVWSVRVLASGEVVFSSGDRTQSFRASTPSEFASRLFDRYKTLPQPKGLVVLLVSYGDARADARQAVINGLPEAVRLMRDDQLGRTQFEYAVLGFIPDREGA